MSADVTFTMPAENAAALHQLATRMLEAWGDEQGVHVELMTSSRRCLEAGLRSVGWAPTGDGAWSMDRRPTRGRL